MATEKPIVSASSLVEASKDPTLIQLIGVLAIKVAGEMASASTESNKVVALNRFATQGMNNAPAYTLPALTNDKVSAELTKLGYDADISLYVETRNWLTQIVLMNSPF